MRAPVFETEDATRVGVRAEAIINDAFLRVIRTGSHEQIVVMTLPPDDETGEEVHPETDQLIVIVEGVGEARVGEYVLDARPGDLVFVAAGTRHNIVNRTTSPLRLISVFAPPAYPEGTVLRTREAYQGREAGAQVGAGETATNSLRAGPRLLRSIDGTTSDR